MNKKILFGLIIFGLIINGCIPPSISNSLKNKLTEKKKIIKNNDGDVQPWEGFRGWSPRQPYGKDSKNATKKSAREKERNEQKQ